MSRPTELKLELQQRLNRDLLAAKLAAGNKDKQRRLLLERKEEIVGRQQKWVDGHIGLFAKYRRTGNLPPQYVPTKLRLVPCQEQWQHDLWRYVKLTHWAMPPNEYVGRRLRILVFDGDYLLGLVGLASCIWGLTARDKWVGWNLGQKTVRLNFIADAYVLGAVPPYNGNYRGSKLLAYLTASNEVRELWAAKYNSEPAAVVTTTLFGHSAVLNRVRHEGQTIWHKVGNTRGLGTMHFSLDTIRLAKELLEVIDVGVPSRLTSGPNWKLRLMRTAIEAVNLRAEDYLMHGYKRGVYVMEYAANSREYLRGETDSLELRQLSMADLVKSWTTKAFPTERIVN